MCKKRKSVTLSQIVLVSVLSVLLASLYFFLAHSGLGEFIRAHGTLQVTDQQPQHEL